MDNIIYDALFFYDDMTIDDFCYVPDFLDYYESNTTDFTNYNFYTNKVPRVSNILAETIYDKSLSDWFKFTDYKMIKEISNNALKVGSIVHEGIEKFLMIAPEAGDEYIENTLTKVFKHNIHKQIRLSYENFKSWYYSMINQGYIINPITCELPTVNPWYGGTIDCIVSITNPIIGSYGETTTYILDFKTSKKISINYYLQTYAYYWSLNWEKKNVINKHDIPDLNGVAILRVDKSKENNFEFSAIDFRVPDNYFVCSELQKAFFNMISWYYSKKCLERTING